MQHDHPGLKYLEAILIFCGLKLSGKAGFTAETFMAYIQCMTAIPELAKHLLERHGFQSDSLEGRFGWYRHSHGGNFLISVKHLLHSEKRSAA